MKVKNLLSLLSLFIAVAITIVSCSHYNMEKAEKNISKNADDESHNNGLNCMNCHKTGGKVKVGLILPVLFIKVIMPRQMAMEKCICTQTRMDKVP